MAPETASLPRALYQLLLMLPDRRQRVLPSLISQGCDTGQQGLAQLPHAGWEAFCPLFSSQAAVQHFSASLQQ